MEPIPHAIRAVHESSPDSKRKALKAELRHHIGSNVKKSKLGLEESVEGDFKLKKLIVTGTLFFSSHFVWGMAHYIEVDDLDAKTRNGEVLTFKGGDAYKLLQVLPSDSFYSGSRRLTITGKDRSFTISCMARSKQIEEKAFKIDPESTECRVIVSKSFKPEQVESSGVWNP